MANWIGSAIGGLLGYKGTQAQNIASAEQAQKQMAFQERMSNTAHQRQIADMKKAGLNPILSAKYGGASSPSGAMAPMQNKAAVALQNATTAANIENITANTTLTEKKAEVIGPISTMMGQVEEWMEDIRRRAEDELDIKLPPLQLTSFSAQDILERDNPAAFKPVYRRGRRTSRSIPYKLKYNPKTKKQEDVMPWFTAPWHRQYQEGYKRSGQQAKQRYIPRKKSRRRNQ